MNAQEYKRTQEVLNTLNKIDQEGEKTKKGTALPREEFLRLLRELHLALEEMFWAGDFKEKKGESD
jgi:hypothetical protein